MDTFTQTVFIKDDGLKAIRKLFNLVWFSNVKTILFFFFLPNQFITIALLSISFYDLQSDITNIAKQTAICATSVQFIYKTIFFAWEKKTIFRMKATIDNKFWDPTMCDTKMKNKIKKHFSFMRFALLSHISTVFFGTVVMVMFPLVPYLDNRKRLPLRIWLPNYINSNESPLYQILFVFLGIHSIVCVMVTVLYDLWFVYCAQHLFVQMELIKRKFQTLANFKSNPNDIFILRSQKCQRIIRNRLRYCSRHHSLLIEFGKDLRKMSSIPNGFQSATTLFTLTVLGFSIAKDHTNLIDFFEVVTFTLSIFVQIFIYTFQGAELEYQSKSLALTISGCKWYLFEAGIRNDLVFMLINAQKPIMITVGGFYDMNNKTLIKIVKLAFSCITLLLSETEN